MYVVLLFFWGTQLTQGPSPFLLLPQLPVLGTLGCYKKTPWASKIQIFTFHHFGCWKSKVQPESGANTFWFGSSFSLEPQLLP